MCEFDDKVVPAVFRCPVCLAIYPMDAEHSMLYYHKHGDDASIFNSLLKSGPQDITNLRKELPCPKCLTPYRTFMQVGQDAQNYLLCWCGYQERIY